MARFKGKRLGLSLNWNLSVDLCVDLQEQKQRSQGFRGEGFAAEPMRLHNTIMLCEVSFFRLPHHCLAGC